MDNVEVKTLEDGRVAVIFDPKKRLGRRATGIMVVASTCGYVAVKTPDGEVTVGFDAYVKE